MIEKEVLDNGGSSVTRLAREGPVDEFQFMIDPAALDAGTSIFRGVDRSLELKLTSTRIFKNNNILLCCHPADR